MDTEPAFSPDGRTIVFERNEGGLGEIYRMNSYGTGVTQLTQTKCEATDRFVLGPTNSHPVFSPDGQWIFFSSSRHCEHGENQFEIYRMRPDGSDLARLSYTEGSASYPTVSPDGSIIAFTAYSRELRVKESDIHVIQADGSGQTRLQHSQGVNWIGSFSPDGKWIALASSRDAKSDDVRNNWDLYLTSTDGETLIRLTDNAACDTDPHFTPDGSRIIFVSDRDGGGEIYSMDISLHLL